MAAILYVYLDDDLTEQMDDASSIGIGAILGSNGKGYFLVGWHLAGEVLEADSDPGIDPIAVSINDSAPGGGVEASHLKLALSEAGLAAAVAGDPLNLGAAINSGAAGAVKVHVQWDNSTGGLPSTEISLQLSAIRRRAA